MVNCKYYVQGYCRFGDDCRFDHHASEAQPTGFLDYSAQRSTSILRQPHFAHPQPVLNDKPPIQKKHIDQNPLPQSVGNNCKYYFQGYCRFGDNCRFNHHASEDYSAQKSTSILRQPQPLEVNPPIQEKHIDQNPLIQSVGNNCKYYVQGHCKFGDNCRFDHHPLQEIDFYSATASLCTSSTLQPLLEVKPLIQEKQIDQSTLIQSVVNDMIATEKGGQWLLSSYVPFKDKVAFPGFEDHSFEEIRWWYYEAQKNGLLDQYKHQVQMMLQDAVLKVKALQSPSQELVNMINNVYNAPSSTPELPGTQVFGSSSAAPTTTPVSTNIFGKTSQNIFGNSPTQQNFSQNNIFGGAAPNTGQASFFGGQTSANMTKPSGSIFGTPQSPQKGSAFEGNNFNQLSPNTTTFGQSPIVQQSLFSNTSPPTQQQNLFGGMQQHFGTTDPQTTNVFQTKAPQPAANLFQTTPNQIQTSPFSQPQTTPNIFQTTPNPVQPSVFSSGGFSQQSSFGQTAANPSSAFGQQVTNVQAHTASIFGGTQAPQIVQNNDKELYSNVEDLSEAEKIFFESDDWHLKKISEKPPTLQMCAATTTGQASFFGGQTSANMIKSSGSIFRTPQKGSAFEGNNFNQLSPNTTTFGQSPLVQQIILHHQLNSRISLGECNNILTTNVFQTKAPQPAANLFQTTPNQIQTSPFSQPQATPNIFQTTPNPVQPSVFSSGGFSQQSSFGQTAANPASAFGQQVTNVQAHTASIFGGTQAPQIVQNNDKELYSNVEDLSEAEKIFFESDDWHLKKISEKPPTLQMCFQ
nr:unnamed protein product [Callosobruchus chinensis]